MSCWEESDKNKKARFVHVHKPGFFKQLQLQAYIPCRCGKLPASVKYFSTGPGQQAISTRASLKGRGSLSNVSIFKILLNKINMHLHRIEGLLRCPAFNGSKDISMMYNNVL